MIDRTAPYTPDLSDLLSPEALALAPWLNKTCCAGESSELCLICPHASGFGNKLGEGGDG